MNELERLEIRKQNFKRYGWVYSHPKREDVTPERIFNRVTRTGFINYVWG